MSKTPILKVLARMSFYWQPMTICGKNVDTLRPCKRSNRDFFWLRSTENTYILSSPVFLYTRTNLVSKTPILKVLARVSFYWQPMTICRKNVDTLRPCKRSNRDFFWLWSTENTHIPSSPVFLYITRGVLRCLLGFLALWGQKPCGGNDGVSLSSGQTCIPHCLSSPS